MSLLLGVGRRIGNEVNSLVTRLRSSKICQFLRWRKVAESTPPVTRQPMDIEIEERQQSTPSASSMPTMDELQLTKKTIRKMPSSSSPRMKSPVNIYIPLAKIPAVTTMLPFGSRNSMPTLLRRLSTQPNIEFKIVPARKKGVSVNHDS